MKARLIGILVVAMTLVFASASYAQVVYDSTVSPLPGNLPSLGVEAYAFTQIGDAVTFAGTARRPRSVTVTMSSWGCQTGNWFSSNCVTTPGATFQLPITLNIYNAGAPTPGSLIVSKTQTFTLPYRPSSDLLNCPDDTPAHKGRWYQASTATCFNGLASNVTFDLTSFAGTLPNSVVFGVSYNSSHFGPNPIGDTQPCNSSSGGCPYDSLNVALSPAVTAGSKTFLDTLYWDTTYGGNYCDSGTNGTGFFRLDSPGGGANSCWGGYIPAAQFIAYTAPTNGDQCKNNGWQSLSRVGGSSFKNQGDCIQYVNTGK